MTFGDQVSKAGFPSDMAPLLLVTIDTEEEFDWSAPFSSRENSVANLRHQVPAQKIFEQFGIKPIYLVDYPVANQADGYGPIKEFYQDGQCVVGTHLQSWVNPPYEETVTYQNSYPGNLPASLEREKLRVLTDTISENLDVQPQCYRAGRYGIGDSTADSLIGLGYETDLSVVPRVDFSAEGGPNFSSLDAHPFWFGQDGALLEIPISSAYVGPLTPLGPKIFNALAGRRGQALHLPGMLARTRLLELIRLTPEGITLDELKKLATTMLATGHRVFCMSYHSPSLMPGNTPYVNDEAELQEFLDRIRLFIDFFVNELGGSGTTPEAIHALASQT